MKKRAQNNSRAAQKKERTFPWIPLTVLFFLAVIMAVSFSIQKQTFRHIYNYEEGQISRGDIYAPGDFSFFDESGQKIEIKKNELIVVRGTKINKTQQLALSELRKQMKQPRAVNFILGIFLVLIIFTVIIVVYAKVYAFTGTAGIKNVILLSILSLLTVVIAKAFIIAGWPVFLIPLAGFSMLAAILISPQAALILTIILSLFLGILDGIRLDVAITMFAGGMTGIYSVVNLRRRRELTKAGLLIGLTNLVSIAGLGILGFSPVTEISLNSAWGMANGLLAAVIATGMLPIFELLFQITTNTSLLELSDLNQPLLKELVLKAPGTYHHCLLVGNLAETAAEAVGANSLLARVGAYFHDIGKLRMAHYFSENQNLTENKHDTLSPTISSLIIINHIKEGVDTAKKHRLGKAIVDIIEQHHGTDLVYYFYRRALEEQNGDKGEIHPENFRYPGPRPQSREAAIVMLADAAEAASRSLPQPAPAKIEETVKRVINNKFTDGQLDECDLTLKDLHRIFDVFTHILNGIYHSRVEYPVPGQGENEQNKDKESPEKNKNSPA